MLPTWLLHIFLTVVSFFVRVDLSVICASVRVYYGARLPAAREFQEFPWNFSLKLLYVSIKSESFETRIYLEIQGSCFKRKCDVISVFSWHLYVLYVYHKCQELKLWCEVWSNHLIIIIRKWLTVMFVCLSVCLCGTNTAKMSPRTTVRLSCSVFYRTAYGTVLYCMVAYRTVRYGTIPGTPWSGATGVQ